VALSLAHIARKSAPVYNPGSPRATVPTGLHVDRSARFHAVEGGAAPESSAGLRCQHFIKDMGIALAEAEKMNLCLPGLALAKQLYEAVRAQGFGRKGTQALLLALEQVNNVKR
jgi:hypothetical protein